MAIPSIELGDGQSIPSIGLGLWQVKDSSQFDQAFAAAVEAGYRHFDSAQIYQNEALLGAAWRRQNLDRADIFITTKIAVDQFGHGRTIKSFDKSLKNLQTDYVDLLLLHFPVPVLRKGSWRALEEIQAAGGARSIGVSNYTIHHLKAMEKYARVMPVVNQVELHVFLQQPELIDYCQANGIVVEAYSPLAHGKNMADAIVTKLAQKYQKSYAQIMLRWCLERGLVVLPKSVTPSRIQANIDIFDFQLVAEDMAALAELDQDLRTCWSPVHVP